MGRDDWQHGHDLHPFLFTGVYKDGATGWYSMTQRYYQSVSGRFTQLVPLSKNLISVNRYAYAGSNPTNFTDPTGLDHCHTEVTVGHGLVSAGHSDSLYKPLLGL